MSANSTNLIINSYSNFNGNNVLGMHPCYSSLHLVSIMNSTCALSVTHTNLFNITMSHVLTLLTGPLSMEVYTSMWLNLSLSTGQVFMF